jgi:hypothetical protein
MAESSVVVRFSVACLTHKLRDLASLQQFVLVVAVLGKIV